MLASRSRLFAGSATLLVAAMLGACGPSGGESPLSPSLHPAGGPVLFVTTTVDWDFAAIIPGVLDPEDLGTTETISLAGSGSIAASTGAATEHITVKGRSLPVGDTERGLGLCLTDAVTCTFPDDGDEVGDGGPGTLLLNFNGVLPVGSTLVSIDLGSLQVDEGYKVSISTDGGVTFGAPIIAYDGDVNANKTLLIGLPTANLVLKLEKAPDIAENDNDYTVKAVTTSFEVPEGCTLTLGYWKTHNESFGGGAPPDDNWLNITPNAELTGFFTTDGANSFPTTGPNTPPFTWFGVFWTSASGNAYYQLAHQYMAAKLNILNGADPSAVSSAIASAEDLFDTYTPADIAGLKGNDPLRQQFITLAGTLGSYNEGLIGPGHCPEEDVEE